jgi:hypothetical protein
LNKQLKRKLEIGILKGHLALELDEMKNKYIRLYFKKADKIAENGLSIFSRQLGMVRDITSIIARAAMLKSLNSRKSWPILVITALLPLLDLLMNKLFPYYDSKIYHGMVPSSRYVFCY